MENSKNLSVRDLSFMGLMIALTFIAGRIITIPTVGGFVQMGDCMVFLSAVLLGKRRGALAAAIGMALVDISTGYLIWSPFTFVIKAGMAYIAGSIIEKFKGKIFSYILGFILGGVFMIIAYFIAGAIIVLLTTGQGLSSATIAGAFVLAAKDIVGNIIQVTTGIVIALPLSGVLVKVRKGASI